MTSQNAGPKQDLAHLIQTASDTFWPKSSLFSFMLDFYPFKLDKWCLFVPPLSIFKQRVDRFSDVGELEEIVTVSDLFTIDYAINDLIAWKHVL